ncbi:MAG: hypothetical protein GX446_02850 [Chthonomonadales bacterium]|nr:hypothetical protein [Chthonomonadales bacterium]
MKRLEGGPTVPGWAVAVVVVVGVAALIFVGFRALTAGGPRDPKTYPPQAYQPPGYSGKSGGSPYGQRPASAGAPTSAGNPYSGAYGGRPGGPGMQGGPMSGGMPQRPDVGVRGTSGGMQGGPYGGR